MMLHYKKLVKLPKFPVLRLTDFDYQLPPDLIAQHPVTPRDQARLLVCERSDQHLHHAHFFDIINYLTAGDVLVINDSKVIPARLQATKLNAKSNDKSTHKIIEIFLLQQYTPTRWECLLGNVHPKPGLQLNLQDGFIATVVGPAADSTWLVEFNKPNILSIGAVPLPPYITEPTVNPDEYQTVYAQPEGSVAAPTAGLHFTTELLDRLKQRGVIIAPITLHVGLGTFAPVRFDDLSKHVMHAEFGRLPLRTAQQIQQAKQSGHRVMAVGTTALRTLEAFADQALRGTAHDGWIDLFITPGYMFRVTNALITNFHLPKTTLLMLVAAFMGKEFMDEAYRIAIVERYRFYSFGDAMLIW